MTFEGFGTDTVSFLSDLGSNNNKSWFDANRSRYEAAFLEPAKAFVDAVAAPLANIAPVVAEPRINRSIFRINRDIRFSNDKTPYKDHLDMWFWEGERKGAVSGLFLRVAADNVVVGAGAHGFDKDRLKRFRDAVVDEKEGKNLRAVVTKIEKAGYEVQGETYKRSPAGFDAGSEFEERMLLHGALWTSFETEHPSELSSGSFVDWAMAHWRPMASLHRWLVDTV